MKQATKSEQATPLKQQAFALQTLQKRSVR